MSESLINDRIGLLEFGNPNGRLNKKIRHQAFAIIGAICKAFLPEDSSKDFQISIGHGYYVSRKKNGGEPATFVSLFNAKIKNGIRFYWLDYEEREYPMNGMVSLEAARTIADDIYNGWLTQMLKILEEHCGVDDALRLDKQLRTAYTHSKNQNDDD